jgi:Na+/H+ antiporter NhaD/arsenite permease-like protein
MCLVLTPLGHNPVPYLLAVAMAANAGSGATITGNPQNMMIGALSGIPYRAFAAALAPVALAGIVMTFAVIVVSFRKEFRDVARVEVTPLRVRVNRVLLIKSLVMSAAIVAGALLLITRRVKPEKVYHEIDWSLLAMFAGLFIVVAGVGKTSLEDELVALAAQFHLDRVAVLTALSTLLSNLASNVPAVLVFRPIVAHLEDPQRGWFVLAMSSTLAGNLTILGSVANLIVVQRARR